MRLGERETDLLEALWDGGELSAADVQRRLQERGIELAFNSVQTMLGRLHQKGAVSRRLEGRTYLYKALAKQQSVAVGAVKRLAARFFGGSRGELAAHLVRSGLKDQDLDRLQALIDEQRQKGKKK